MGVQWARKLGLNRRPVGRRAALSLRYRKNVSSDVSRPSVEDPGFVIWAALTKADSQRTDADLAVLAWLAILPVTLPPPEAAARLLRRYVPRLRRFNPGTERLSELLVLISRYGRRCHPACDKNHKPEE